MSKLEIVCKAIKEDEGNTPRKELVAKIAKETGYNVSTVNSYYSKCINADKPATPKEEVITEPKEFKRSTVTKNSKGYEITIDKQERFLTAITVVHSASGKTAVTTADGSEELINEKIEDMMERLIPANERPDLPSKSKRGKGKRKKLK